MCDAESQHAVFILSVHRLPALTDCIAYVHMHYIASIVCVTRCSS